MNSKPFQKNNYKPPHVQLRSTSGRSPTAAASVMVNFSLNARQPSGLCFAARGSLNDVAGLFRTGGAGAGGAGLVALMAFIMPFMAFMAFILGGCTFIALVGGLGEALLALGDGLGDCFLALPPGFGLVAAGAGRLGDDF